MSQALAPAVWTLAGLLVLAGVAKLRDPGPAANALRGIAAPATPAFVRAIAAGEVVVGGWCLIAPGPANLALLAAAYLAFAGAVGRMYRGRVSDCGCFGEQSFEPGAAHLALNLLAATLAFAGILAPPPDAGAVVDRSAFEAVALAAGVGGAVLLAYVAFTAVPAAWGAYRGAVREDVR